MIEPKNNEMSVEEAQENGKGRSNGGNNSGKTGDDLNLAAVYVSDAQYSRNIFFDTTPKAVRLYLIYNHWALQVLVYVLILVLLSLALFEDPAVLLLPLWVTMLMELVLLAALSARLTHYASVIPRQHFWKDPKNICIQALIILTLVDMVIYGSLKWSGYYGVRWSRVLRPLLLVNVTEGRQLRRAFRSIRNALPQILVVFLLFMFSLLIFSLMALKLFSRRGLSTVEGSPYFTSYLEIVFELYVLVTTANSPDVMMPAYNSNQLFAVFFILYILVNTYIFMSVFLAVVYNNYKKYLKEEVQQLVRAKRHKMVRAFAVLQERVDGGEPVVTRASWNQLVQLVQSDISHAHRELLWSVSDDSNRGCIGKMAFVQLADLLNIPVIAVKSRPHPFQTWLPSVYDSTPSCLLRHLVQHRMFVYAYDLIILVNAVFIGLDEGNPLIARAEWGFLALYLLEILLKLYTFEPRAFFSRHQFWNWFDTVIIVSALVATIINAALKSSGFYSSRQVLDIVFILRVLRLIRIVDSIERFRSIINTLIKIGPTILTFIQLVLVVYYIFAMVGMELFKGKIQFFDANSTNLTKEYCGNPQLKDSVFAKLNYCRNNFNDVVSSCILLVELTVVNQWHVLSSGFTKVTNESARIFFVLFHIVVVIIFINIFVAFVLEAFFVEYSVDKSVLQTSLEKKIEELDLNIKQDGPGSNLVEAMETQDADQGPEGGSRTAPSVMFSIASKRYKTVEGLLQRMFEDDLGSEDYAEDQDEPSNPNFSNPTFNSL